MKKLLALTLFLFAIVVFSACSEEEIKPQNTEHKGGLGEHDTEGL